EVFLGDGITNRLDGFLIQSQLARPLGICSNKKDLYFVEGESSSLRQSKSGFVSTLIGINMIEFGDIDGKFPHAMMQYPSGIGFNNDQIYIADTYNQKIKSFDLQTEELKTIISNTKDKAILNCPNDLIIHDQKVYIINKFNNKIVVYDIDSRETTWWELKLRQ
ncbi:MAG: hypothetical protein JKX95_04370, partial [Bacteroidia bacterium]|nr:hypothetical protein [Bacteroidia bacterium]